MKAYHSALWVLSAILVTGLITSCGKSGTAQNSTVGTGGTAGSGGPVGTVMPVPEARDEHGWPFYDVVSEGFGIAIPSDWLHIDMNSDTFDAKLRDTIAQNPGFESILGNLRQQLVNGVKFVGIDKSSVKSGYNTNVTILRFPRTSDKPLDTIVEEMLGQLDRLPNVEKPVTHERMKMASGDWIKLHLKKTTKNQSGKSTSVAQSQFITARGNNHYTVILSILADQEENYVATFEKIARSFRFTK